MWEIYYFDSYAMRTKTMKVNATDKDDAYDQWYELSDAQSGEHTILSIMEVRGGK